MWKYSGGEIIKLLSNLSWFTVNSLSVISCLAKQVHLLVHLWRIWMQWISITREFTHEIGHLGTFKKSSNTPCAEVHVTLRPCPSVVVVKCTLEWHGGWCWGHTGRREQLARTKWQTHIRPRKHHKGHSLKRSHLWEGKRVLGPRVDF